MTLKLPPGMTFSDGTDVASDTEPDLEFASYQEPEEDSAPEPESDTAPVPGAETEG
jgi:hypothetical protein